MDISQQAILEKLSELKKNSACALKSEFESEGATYEDTVLLAGLAENAGLDFVVKIGGCAAVNDIYQLQKIGVKKIVAPMIESPYAMQKFVKTIQSIYDGELPELLINIETAVGMQKLDAILNTDEIKFIKGIVFGRSDLIGSLNITKEFINAEILLKLLDEACEKVAQKSLQITLGGGICPESTFFLRKLASKHQIKFETRKVVFDFEIINSEQLSATIIKALEFEQLWICHKKSLFGSVHNLDEKRLNELSMKLEHLLFSS